MFAVPFRPAMMSPYPAYPPPPPPGLACSPPPPMAFNPGPFVRPGYMPSSPPVFFSPPAPVPMFHPRPKAFSPFRIRGQPNHAPAYIRSPFGASRPRQAFSPANPVLPPQLHFSLNPESYQGFRPPPSRPLYEPQPRSRRRSRKRYLNTSLSPKAKPFVPRQLRAPVEIMPVHSYHEGTAQPQPRPAHVRANDSVSSTMSEPMPFTPTGFNDMGGFDHTTPLPMPVSTPFIDRDHALRRRTVWSENKHAVDIREERLSPVTREERPTRPAPVLPRPWRQPTPGLFLHHDPPPFAPRHSTFRSDGQPGLEELPLPPLRATEDGEVEFLSWKMAYHWGLYSPEIEFPGEGGREFWRTVGEDRDLLMPNAAQYHPERMPDATPALQHATITTPPQLAPSPPEPYYSDKLSGETRDMTESVRESDAPRSTLSDSMGTMTDHSFDEIQSRFDRGSSPGYIPDAAPSAERSAHGLISDDICDRSPPALSRGTSRSTSADFEELPLP